VGEIAVGGGWIGDNHYAESGAVGGDVAGHRVLKGDGVGGIHTKATKGGEIDVGLGFTDGDVVTAGDEIEKLQHAAMGEVTFDVGVGRVGCEADAQAGVAGGVEQCKRTGQGWSGEGEGARGDAVAFFKDDAVGVPGIGGPIVVNDVGMADDVVKFVAIDRDAVLGVDLHPGIDQHRFGVHQQSVKIKYESAQHGEGSTFCGGRLDASGESILVVRMIGHIRPAAARPLLFATASLFLMTSALADTKPTTRNRAEIAADYKWDFSPIYTDWAAWEQGMKDTEAKMDAFAALKGTLKDGPSAVLAAYRLFDEIGILQYRVFRYPQLQRDTDTRNQDVAGKLQRVQALFAKFGTATAWFNPELLAVPEATMLGWLDTTPDLAPYRFPILDAYRQQKHVLDEKGEQLLSYATRFNETPRSVYSELSTSDIQFPTITLTDGKEVKLSPGAYQSILATNYNQADRAKAFEAYLKTYEATKNTYAAIYRGILERGWFMAQARDYPTTLARALDGNAIPVEVYTTLIDTVRAGTAPLQRYIKLRQKILGLETYHLYDGQIPLVKDDTVWPYKPARDLVRASVAPLGAEYQAKLSELLDGNRLDVYENDGKRSGAYSAGVYGVGPYVLMNYNDTQDAVFTFAHEMGHAMHTRLSEENQPFVTADYTIFVAEVASTINERLMLEKLLSESKEPKERFLLLQHAIDSIVGTFYTQVLFADFEYRAHTLAEKGEPLTADVFSTLYDDLLKAYYGDAIVRDDLYRYTWTRIPHFYNSPYYVYQYATCFASSAQLYKAINTGTPAERAAATERYLTLLKSGGNDHPMEQLRKAGVDLSKRETVQAVIDQMDELVTRLEAEAAKLP
jgi:oligoendopeptidase F